MEPILISSLKKFVQNAILNNQSKLNPNLDAYIDENEIGELLSYFGAKDISELQEDVGMDTYKPEKQKDEQTSAEVIDEDSPLLQPRGFDEANSAAEELVTAVSMDMLLEGSGTPYSSTYKSLCNQRDTYERNGDDTSDIDTMIETVREQIKEYIRENQANLIQNRQQEGSISVFHYGDNKTGILTQSISFGGNNAIKDAGNDTNDDDDESEGDGTTTTDSSQEANSLLDGGLKYSMSLETENLQVRSTADVRTDNTDIYLGAAYNKTVDDDRMFVLALSGRETIEPGHSTGSGGIAMDYQYKNLSFGAYGYASHESEVGEETSHEYKLEGYLKYKKNIQLVAGYEDCGLVNAQYLRAKLYGDKTFEENSLRLTGSLEAKVERNNYNVEGFDLSPDTDINVRMRGGVYFNTQNINASISGMISYDCTYDPDAQGDDKYTHNGSVTVFGSLQKDKFSISAMVSAFTGESTYSMIEEESPVRYTSSVTLGISDLYQGISPYISYTLDGSTSGRQHQIGGGLNLSIDKLSRQKKVIENLNDSVLK